MTNIVFSPTLQAPIGLSNPTGALALASDPSASIHQQNPIPNQGAVALVGAAVRLSLALSTTSGAASVSGVTPAVVRGTVTHPAVTTGALAASGGAPIVAISISAPQLTYPRVMLIGDGGDQSYGCNAANSYTPWLTAPAGNTSQTFVQQVGAWDVWVGSGVFESSAGDWTSSGKLDRDNLARALLKQSTTYTVKLSATRPTLYFPYHIMCQGETANNYGGYQQYIQQIVDMTGWVFESIGGVGTITPASDTGNLINYSSAYQATIGNAQPGQSIVGANYGTLSSGSPTGAQGVARMSGNYAAIKLLMRGYTGDSRFSFTLQMGSANCAGVFLDNAFCALDGNGKVADSSLDGVTIAPGSQQGGGYPGLDTTQVVLAHGNHNFFDQLQIMVTTLGSGNFYNFANFGQYANNYQFGTAPLTAGWTNLNGGLIEAAIGDGAASWEYFQTAGVNASGWPAVRSNYYQGMAFCVPPAWWNAATMGAYEPLVGLGTMLPATDGSSTASFAVNGTLTAVTAGSALEYQLMRYGLCTALLHNGLAAFGVSGYNYALTRWYDEFGDDSLTQVNVKRGYLGVPTSNPPTAATWNQGTLGVWSRTWTNGLSIVNPRGNGAQTVALGGTYQKLQGTQQASINSGAFVTSVTVGDGDGIVLLGPKSAATLTITTTSLPNGTVGTAYSATMAATGGFPPYTWTGTCTPNTGGKLSLSTAGVWGGTPGTAETETCVSTVTDAAKNSATVTLSLKVNAVSNFAPIQFFYADQFTQGTYPVVSGGGPDGQLYSRYGSASGQKYGMVTANATSPTFNSQSSNFIRPGHTQSFQVSIQNNTSGFPGDGETPAANGMWGFLLEAPTFSSTGYGQQGDWVHFGAWMYVQSTTQLRTTTLEAGALKFCRSSYPTTTASKDDCHICEEPNGFALLNEYDPNNTANNNYPDERSYNGTDTNQTGFPRDQWFFYEWGVYLQSNGDNAIRRAWINNVLQLERNGRVIKWRTNDGTYHTTTLTSVGVPSLPSATAALQEFFIFTFWNGHPAVDTVIWMDGLITATEARTTFNTVDNLGNPIIGSGNSP